MANLSPAVDRVGRQQVVRLEHPKDKHSNLYGVSFHMCVGVLPSAELIAAA